MSKRGNPKDFAWNLRILTAMNRLSIPSAAKKISAKYDLQISPRWYRSLCDKGVGQSHERTEAKLRAIAKFFRVKALNHLWDSGLIICKLSYKLVPPRNAEYTVRLAELLDSGNHDYLRQLILRLYEAEFGSGAFPGSADDPTADEDRYFMPEYEYKGGLNAVEGEGVSYQLEPEEGQSEETQEDDLVDWEAD